MVRTVVFYTRDGRPLAEVEAGLRIRWPEFRVVCLGPEGQERMAEENPDLIFLGPSMTQEGGAELVLQIRTTYSGGVVAFSSNPTEGELLEIIDAGADDYLPMNSSTAQLVARVSALMRRIARSDGQSTVTVKCGELSIDAERHEAQVDGQKLSLSPTEFKLLYHLAENSGKVVTQDELHRLIWECDGRMYIQSLRKFVGRLRRRLAGCDSDVSIVSIPRIGYRLLGPDA